MCLFDTWQWCIQFKHFRLCPPLFALYDASANDFDCAGLSAPCYSLVLKKIIYKYFISDSSILETDCWYFNSTDKRIHTSFQCSFGSSAPNSWTCPNTNNDACIFIPFLLFCEWLEYIQLLLIGWNSVSLFIPSHFFVSCLPSQGWVWAPDFFRAFTELVASRPWAGICWIWRESVLD